MKRLNKKAFTLIELLAVILILGIIALIAIPTVTNIIEDAKKQSFIRSAEGLLSSVDTKLNIEMLKGENINVAYNFKNNKLLNGELDIKGEMPKEGKIKVNNDGDIALAIIYDEYCITKSFTDDKLTANSLDENGCIIPGNNSILKSYANLVNNAWLNNEEVFYAPAYRDNIVTASFIYQESVPSNALISWDVSNAQNESIIAYLMPNGNKYDLYIISEDNIYTSTRVIALFKNFTALQKVNFVNFNTSNANYMQNMFQDCINLETVDLTSFDTDNLFQTLQMFERCASLKEINLASFDTENVTNMAFMFTDCKSLVNLDLSNFNTSKVTNINYIFDGCEKLENLNLKNWDTSNISYAANVFADCYALKEDYLYLNKWNTSKLTNMRYLFSQNRSIKEFDLKGWDTSNVVNMYCMFCGCNSAISYDLSTFNTEKVEDMSRMFYWNNSLVSLDLSSFDTHEVTNMTEMFSKTPLLTNVDTSENFVTDGKTITNMFTGSGISSID